MNMNTREIVCYYFKYLKNYLMCKNKNVPIRSNHLFSTV